MTGGVWNKVKELGWAVMTAIAISIIAAMSAGASFVYGLTIRMPKAEQEIQTLTDWRTVHETKHDREFNEIIRLLKDLKKAEKAEKEKSRNAK